MESIACRTFVSKCEVKCVFSTPDQVQVHFEWPDNEADRFPCLQAHIENFSFGLNQETALLEFLFLVFIQGWCFRVVWLVAVASWPSHDFGFI